MILKRTPYRNKKILDAARGAQCTIQGPNCAHDSETVVFAHFNDSWAGKGKGQKADDFAGCFACHACHSDYDSGNLPDANWYLRRAMYRTLRKLIDEGIIG